MQQLIVLASPDGVVDMTPQAISARTSIPLDIILEGLKVLSEPDPYTRTPGEEGRRIVLMDSHRPWGWRLVNHGKYMRLRNMEQKREADRARMAEKRLQTNDVAIESQDVANVAHSDSDSDIKIEARRGTRLPSDWEPSELLKAWASKERPDLELVSVVPKFRDYWVAVPGQRGLKLDWEATFRNFIRGEKSAGPKVIAPAPGPGKKLCSYCEKVATGAPNGTWACQEHFDKALFHEPVPRMRGVVAKPVAGAD